MKKLFIILFTIFSILSAFSQKQGNIWYYRNGEGLNFNYATPLLLSNGSIGYCEGTATISDTFGNMLFYTDGVTIWNSMHSPMPNGSGLMGDWSTAQSALIIPKPKSSSIYYVFTNDQSCGPLSYSIVDMNLDAGLGDVISGSKNIPLLTSTFEKMAAVHHCNGKDIWIMTMEANTGDFYAWLINERGLCNCPVISSTGPVHSQSWGCMKFSNNGKK